MTLADYLPNLLAIIWVGHWLTGLIGAFEGSLTQERWAARSWLVWLVITAGSPGFGWTVIGLWASVSIVLFVLRSFEEA